MSTSATQVFEQPALAAGIAILQAGDQFITDMGTNPLQWVANYPGAKLKELGSIQLALGNLIPAEGAALVTEGQALIQNLISKLQALQTSSSSSSSTTPPPTGTAA